VGAHGTPDLLLPLPVLRRAGQTDWVPPQEEAKTGVEHEKLILGLHSPEGRAVGGKKGKGVGQLVETWVMAHARHTSLSGGWLGAGHPHTTCPLGGGSVSHTGEDGR
jgi:hypothetical protein